MEFDIQDEEFELPAFSVQTTVENAITHGILEREDKEGSLITISSYQKRGKHFVVVEDNGVGFDIEKIDLDEGSHSGINSRLFMFVHRANNYVKPEAVITGGNCNESTRLGDVVMKK